MAFDQEGSKRPSFLRVIDWFLRVNGWDFEGRKGKVFLMPSLVIVVEE